MECTAIILELKAVHLQHLLRSFGSSVILSLSLQVLLVLPAVHALVDSLERGRKMRNFCHLEAVELAIVIIMPKCRQENYGEELLGSEF